MILTIDGPLESAVRFITVLLIFLFVLALTYFTTRMIGGYQKQKLSMGNIEVMETMRLAQNKYLQIIRAGEKYLLIAICKDSVTLLSELSPEQMIFTQQNGKPDQMPDFNGILEKAKQWKKDRSDEKKQADKDE